MEKDYKKRTAYRILLLATIAAVTRVVQIISMVAFPVDYAHPASSPMYWIAFAALTLGLLPLSIAVQYNAKRAGLKIVRILFLILSIFFFFSSLVFLFILYASSFLPELYSKI